MFFGLFFFKLSFDTIPWFFFLSEMSEEEIFAVVRNYVPGAVIPFLSGAEEKWASELRRVSVIFFNLVCHLFRLCVFLILYMSNFPQHVPTFC